MRRRKIQQRKRRTRKMSRSNKARLLRDDLDTIAPYRIRRNSLKMIVDQRKLARVTSAVQSRARAIGSRNRVKRYVRRCYSVMFNHRSVCAIASAITRREKKKLLFLSFFLSLFFHSTFFFELYRLRGVTCNLGFYSIIALTFFLSYRN